MIIKWKYIMIHHSFTKDGLTVDWDAIRKYHIKERHFVDIGYHFGIEKVSGIYQVQIGRSLDKRGAHCKEQGMNYKSIGICVVGNYDVEVPTIETLGFLAKAVVAPLMRKFDIPVENIIAHRDYATYKSCPGKLFLLAQLKRICEEIIV